MIRLRVVYAICGNERALARLLLAAGNGGGMRWSSVDYAICAGIERALARLLLVVGNEGGRRFSSVV